MKTNKILISLLMICVMVAGGSSFGFAAESTDETYGNLLFDYGIVKGIGGELKEDQLIKRVEMMTLMSRLYPNEFESYNAPEKATFIDVPVTHWGFKAVEFAYAKGITKGSGNNRFEPDQMVDYNQVSLLMMRTLGYDTSDLNYFSAAAGVEQRYGLRLTVPTEGTKALQRGEVFELLAKSLSMDDSNGILGYRMISSDVVAEARYIDRIIAILERPVAVAIGGTQYDVYYGDGDYYTGQFDGKFPQGYGIMRFQSGDLYAGEYLNGALNGYGLFLWSDDVFYEGMWTMDQFNGYGTYTYLDGSYQKGEWTNGQLTKTIDELTPLQIGNGERTPSVNVNIVLKDTLGVPMKGIAITVTDELLGVSYQRISSIEGVVSVPVHEGITLLSLELSSGSAYRFSISDSKQLITAFGAYEIERSFELIK